MTHLDLRDVEWTEVGPRDGLQALKAFIPTERKRRFIEDLVAAGTRTIEVTSFVSPKAIPQLRDAAELCATLPRVEGVAYCAFIPNVKGFEQAVEARLHRVGMLAASTDEFNQRNLGATIAESLGRIREVAQATAGTGIALRGYVGTCVECPITGPVNPEKVLAIAESLLEAGCEDVFLGETIGRGTPASMARLLDVLLPRIPAEKLGGHYHDTWGQALANVLVSLERGLRRFDTAVAGLGGCPAAEGAAGNLATEDFLYLLEGFGVETGADLEAIAAVGAGLCSDQGIRVDSKAGRAQVARSGRERAKLDADR